MIEQIKKVAEQLEENESKKLLLESEITHLEEVLKHGVTSRFAEENAIYIYSPKTGHEIRKKLEEDYKLVHPKLSIPKKIAEHDWMKHLIECGNLSQFEFERYDDFFNKDDEQFLKWVNTGKNENILYIYLASKALGVELVEVSDE